MRKSSGRLKKKRADGSGTAEKPVSIPDNKRYFRIGEVSRIIGVEPYVLRYWENEFSEIRPGRADSNQRTYQRKDLEAIFEVKRLLYEEKLTIEGAKKRLREQRSTRTQGEDPEEAFGLLQEIRLELQQILRLL
ncbi:MAG: MerR family transcriptional regulator [Desulfobacteraceae bacterium]